jgi:hypothetical protein
MDPISMAMLGIGALSSVFGGLQGNKLQSQQIDMAKGASDLSRWLGLIGWDRVGDNANPAREAFNAMLSGTNTDLAEQMDRYRAIYGEVPGLTQNREVDAALAPYLSVLAGGGVDDPRGFFSQLIGRGGQTDDTRRLFERATQWGPGEGMGEVLNVGQQLLNTRGRTPTLQTFMDRSGETVNAGGFTGGLSQAESLANAIASTGGRTMETGAAQAALLPLIFGGGNDPSISRLEDKSYELADEKSTIPLGMKLALTRDQAGRASKQAAEAAIRRASARSGDFGVNPNDMREFAEMASANEANALASTLFGHEDSLLKDKGIRTSALSAAEAALKAKNERLGIGTQGISNLSRIEGDKTISGVNAMADINRAATQRAGTYGQIGLGSEDQATRNMALGGQLTNTYNDNDLSRIELGNRILSGEMQNLLGGAGALNNFMNTYNSGNQAAARLFLDNGALNLNRGNSQIDGWLRAFGLGGQTIDQGLMNSYRGATGLQGLAQMWSGLSQGMFGNMVGAMGGMPQSSQVGNALMGGGLGMLTDPRLWGKAFGSGGGAGGGGFNFGAAGPPPAGGGGGYG